MGADLINIRDSGGGKARILFEPQSPHVGVTEFEADFAILKNGGVLHRDGDGHVRWHPPHRIYMVIFEKDL
jgi:hypothetical protein